MWHLYFVTNSTQVSLLAVFVGNRCDLIDEIDPFGFILVVIFGWYLHFL